MRVMVGQVRLPLPRRAEHPQGRGVRGGCDADAGDLHQPVDAQRGRAAPGTPCQMLLMWMRVVLCIYKHSRWPCWLKVIKSRSWRMVLAEDITQFAEK